MKEFELYQVIQDRQRNRFWNRILWLLLGAHLSGYAIGYAVAKML